MWLIDSSLFIDWMRLGRSPLRILRPFVLAEQVLSCGVIRLEVVRGALKPALKTELNALFDVIPEVLFTPAFWTKTAELAWTLDRKGIVLPATDLIIGSCALQAGAVLISTDPHFASIPNLTVRTHLPGFSGKDS
jgi:predicted nucleic acid-binding protein